MEHRQNQVVLKSSQFVLAGFHPNSLESLIMVISPRPVSEEAS